MLLIVFDLLFQMQEKSRRSISKKGRNALVDLIWRSSEIGRYNLVAYQSTRFFLHLKKQVKYYQKQWYLGFNSDTKNYFTAPRGVLPFRK